MNLTRLMMACGKAFIFSVALTPIVRDVFRSYNVVDRPGRRKAHIYPIPRVGGIPIMIAYLLALNSLRGAGSVFPLHWLQTILSGAAIIFLTGLVDDFHQSHTQGETGRANRCRRRRVRQRSEHRPAGKFRAAGLAQSASDGLLAAADNQRSEPDRRPRRTVRGIAFWATLAFFAVGLSHGNTLSGVHGVTTGGRAARDSWSSISIPPRFFSAIPVL